MKGTVIALAVALAGYGCAGRTPNPVATHQLGDERRSCNALKAELRNTEDEILKKLPHADKTSQNIALGVAGWFFIVPWFFMDLSKADQIEIEALRRRYNNIVILAEEKQCGFENKQLPDPQHASPPSSTDPKGARARSAEPARPASGPVGLDELEDLLPK